MRFSLGGVARAAAVAVVVLGGGWLVPSAALAVASSTSTAPALVESSAVEPTPAVDPDPDDLTPTPAPTEEPPPDDTPAPSPEPTDQPQPTPEVPGDEVEAPVEPPLVEEPPADEAPEERPATPPALVAAEFSWASVAIAFGVLVLSGILLAVFAKPGRRDSPEPEPDQEPASVRSPTVSSADPADTLALMIDAGEAMIDSGYPVNLVMTSLEDIATVNGKAGTEVLVFPTALMVSMADGRRADTKVVSSGHSPLLLFQIEALGDAVNDARSGVVPPTTSRERILAVRRLSLPFGVVQRILGYVVLSIGLSAVLGASWVGVALAAVLGALVGVLLLLGRRIGAPYQAIVTVGAAFLVAIVVFLFVRADLDPGVFPSLVAPLVILLPGALLTTAVIELSTGQIMSGSSRLAAGAMQLVLLAFGIVAAGALVGVPSIQLDAAAQPLGPAAPWIGVALFGVGLVVYQCARPGALGWILLVLYVAYGAQVIGDILFGGVLSAFIGAVVMTPVALVVARQTSGPPAIVSFLPAFWLLVPGALGLVGVTNILEGDASGIGTLVATAATMVAIALGVLLGLGVSTWISGSNRLGREPGAPSGGEALGGGP